MRGLVIVSFVVIPFAAVAQDWELFPVGMKLHYQVDTNQYIRISADTSRVVGNREVYYLGSDALKPCLPWEVDAQLDNFVDSLIREGSSYVKHYAGQTDSSVFDFGITIGESFLFRYLFAWPDDYDSIQVTLDSVYVDSMFGVADSVKEFSLQAWNGGPDSGSLNENQMRLSKAHGLLESPLFFIDESMSGSSYESGRLAGMETDSSQLGFQLPDFADFFQYEPGWILKWLETSTNYGHPPITGTYRDSITEVSVTPAGVSITFDRHSSTSSFFGLEESFDRDLEGIFEANHHYLGGTDQGLDQLSSQWGGVLTRFVSGHWINTCQLGQDADVCYRYHYSTGLGLVGRYQCGFSGEWETRLIGFKSDSTQWGNHWPIGLDEITKSAVTIEPNPCRERIRISNHGIQPNSTYLIRDIAGSSIQSGPLGDGNILLDFPQAGIFFIRIGNLVGKFIKI